MNKKKLSYVGMCNTHQSLSKLTPASVATSSAACYKINDVVSCSLAGEICCCYNYSNASMPKCQCHQMLLSTQGFN